MLKEKTCINVESYIETFDKKFSNFCTKNILSLEYTIYPDKVEVIDDSGNMKDKLIYEFDYSKPVTTTIYEIGVELKKFYPKFYDKTEKVYTSEDFKELLRKYTPQEIENIKPETVKKLAFTVFRVVNNHNEISVIDHTDNNKKKAYRLSIPAIEFVNILYKDIDKAYSLFKTRARYLHLL